MLHLLPMNRKRTELMKALKDSIIGDETLVYGYDAETKVEPFQYVGIGSSQPKKPACVS